MMGLEPATFCMASRRSEQRRMREMPANSTIEADRRRERIRAKRGRSGRIRNLSAAEVPIADDFLPLATSGVTSTGIQSGSAVLRRLPSPRPIRRGRAKPRRLGAPGGNAQAIAVRVYQGALSPSEPFFIDGDSEFRGHSVNVVDVEMDQGIRPSVPLVL